MTDPKEETQGQPSNAVENILEQSLFLTRWLLAPIYIVLALSLILILFKFGQESWEMARHIISISVEDTILGILALIDLSLMANLLLMIIFGGYQNFVSKLDLNGHEDTPDWIGHVGFGDLKLKLMASIVAISAIELLKFFLTIERTDDRTMKWGIAIHLTFVVSAVLLATMDYMMSRSHKEEADR